MGGREEERKGRRERKKGRKGVRKKDRGKRERERRGECWRLGSERGGEDENK